MEDFILEHADDDTSRLLLGASKWPGLDVPLAVNCIISRRKLRDKVPQWYGNPSFLYPNTISAEQCSSTETAEYKASVAGRFIGKDGCIADLTGGLGVDSWAFSKVAGRVLYNEMNPDLVKAAEHNFALLGIRNAIIRNFCAAPGSIGTIFGSGPEAFRPDLVFMDPARRSSSGKKVFLLEDCQPDVLTLMDEVLALSRFLMLKLSPMADISMVMNRLNTSPGRPSDQSRGLSSGHCRELHAVSLGGECKELLVLLDREYDGPCRIHAVELSRGHADASLVFTMDEERSSVLELTGPADALTPGSLLFDPGKSLGKTGASSVLCSRFSLRKLGRFTSLYLCPEGADTGELARMGRLFRLVECLPLDKRSMKTLAGRYPRAEVSARNIPMSSEELRRKLGTASSDLMHVFGVKCDCCGNLLLVCERV